MVADDTMNPADRVAGALVVLYAQPLVRVVKLTIDDVQQSNRAVALILGDDRMELPDRSLP
ncbi:hypothetical protein [Nocardia asiatica]|uniref:hypothetical protein n=1 Tax=Nocardia asiatica TaxID=209252 RepID=UPI0002F51F6D|nr:hypothetical protein [Nocardia asiatica]